MGTGVKDNVLVIQGSSIGHTLKHFEEVSEAFRFTIQENLLINSTNITNVHAKTIIFVEDVNKINVNVNGVYAPQNLNIEAP